jgi:hypothetical protein
MKGIPFFAAILLLLGLPGCQAGKYPPGALPERQLRFGGGGGFAGAYEEYVLLENGQLFYRNAVEKPLTELPAIRRSVTRELWQQAEALPFAAMEFEHPGNLYHFLEWRDGAAARRLTWGDPAWPVDPKVRTLYEELRGAKSH